MHLETSQLRAAGTYSLIRAQRIGGGIARAFQQQTQESQPSRLHNAVRDPRVLGAGAVLAAVVPPIIVAAQRKRVPAAELATIEESETIPMSSTPPIKPNATADLIENTSRVPGREIGIQSELE